MSATKLLCDLSSINSNAFSKKNETALKCQLPSQNYPVLKEALKGSEKEDLVNLAASVAHDIQSPLAVVDITLSMLKNNISDEQFNIIRQATQVIKNIVKNLLEKYRASEMQLEKESNYEATNVNAINLSNFLEMAVAHKKNEWSLNSCNILLVIEKNTQNYFVNADPDYIQRMLSNLLNNAYEALENHREIIIRLYQEEDKLKLSIKDSGCGIPENEINKVLSGMSLKHPGVGLGLLGAIEYMKKIEGNLLLSSKENQGTEVILSFPICLDNRKYI